MIPTVRREPRADRERGAILVLSTMLLTVLIGIVAIVVDLGALRASARVDQSVADFAALSAGNRLGVNDPRGACQNAVNYLNGNLDLSDPINATTFCAGLPSACTSSTAQVTASATSGDYDVAVHYPVPNSEIADPHIVGGARLNDGTPCYRMRVLVTSTQGSLFAGIFGASDLATTRTATVKSQIAKGTKTPALWLLDPTGCTALGVGGGSKLTVGTSGVPGIITIDSDGSTCTGQQKTLTTGGAGTLLKAVPTTGTPRGAIQLYALPLTATTCTGWACNPAEVSSGMITPQPTGVAERATRARVDDVYNCHSTYPTYHGITPPSACDVGSTPPYIDNLKTAVGTSGAPSVGSYQRWSTGHSCNAPSGTTSVSGNWWIDCSGPGGLKLGNGANVEFRNGNVIFDNGFSMSGGTLKFNTSPTAGSTLPTACTPAGNVTTPCIGAASSGAALVYLRAGDIDITGGVLTVNHAMMYVKNGYVKVNSSPPVWKAPTEGPFNYLALWTDMPASSGSTSKFSMAGGSGVELAGVFFVPEAAPFKLAGGGNWGQQNAQFIAYRLDVTGGGILTMAPDPASGVKTPSFVGSLIR